MSEIVPTQAIAAFTKGRACINGGKIIFDSKNSAALGSHEILLVHGIELLLESYILLKDNDHFKDGRQIYNKFRHNYLAMFRHCQSLDQQLFTNASTYIEFIAKHSYENVVDARFPDQNRILVIPEDIYQLLDEYLIKPILNELKPVTQQTVI